MKQDRWLLPEGIEEVLPQQAKQLEQLRRRLLDIYDCWGYELVMPPFIEYLESLLTGTGNDLDLQTFKLTDQLSGRMMGVRADMTPQVSRIAAHHLKQEIPLRLCYMGTVLKTRPDGFAGSRSPLQIGAELYGHQSVESDVEILCLMLETLKQAGIEQVYLDLGHVGIYRGLVQQAGLDSRQEADLFDALQRKARTEIEGYVSEWKLAKQVADMLLALMDLNGGDDVLDMAVTQLDQADATVKAALDNLQQIASQLKTRQPELNLHYDLAELRGYNYHTGVVFAVYVPGCGQAIAQGGRYDDIGEVFGNARPATGFSTDLKVLVDEGRMSTTVAAGILAPVADDEQVDALTVLISELRLQGKRVIQTLPGQQGNAQDMGCAQEIVFEAGQWQVKNI